MTSYMTHFGLLQPLRIKCKTVHKDVDDYDHSISQGINYIKGK